MFHLFKKKTAASAFTAWQLSEIENSKAYPVDVSIFAYPELSCTNMISARTALLDGASPKYVSNVIAAYRNGKIEEREYEKLLDKSVNMIDLDLLIKTHKVDEEPSEAPKFGMKDILCGVTLGDIAGSRYEFVQDSSLRLDLDLHSAISPKSTFTDDTVLTFATLCALDRKLQIRKEDPDLSEYSEVSTYPFLNNPFTEEYRKWARKYPDSGFGSGFYYWCMLDVSEPYGSLGNGSAMRVAPVGGYFSSIKDVITYATASAAATHNHPEGVKGAIVTAVCFWMAKNGYSKKQIYDYMIRHYRNKGYDFNDFSMEELKDPTKERPSDAKCMFAVPASVICFYHSDCFEEVFNDALSFNGDTDTIGAIAGAYAGAYYGVPEEYRKIAKELTLPELKEKI